MLRVKLYCWFSVDVTKIQTTKLSTLLRFYFHDVLKGLKTILVKRSFCISFVRRKRKWKFSLEISNSPLLDNMQIHYLVFFVRSLYSFICFLFFFVFVFLFLFLFFSGKFYSTAKEIWPIALKQCLLRY